MQFIICFLFSDPKNVMKKPYLLVMRSDYLFPTKPTFGSADEWLLDYSIVVKTENAPDRDLDFNLEKVTIWDEWSCCSACSSNNKQISGVITRQGMCSIRKIDPQIPIKIPANVKDESSRAYKQWKRLDDWLTNEFDFKQKGIPCFSARSYVEFDEIRPALIARFLKTETKNNQSGLYLQTSECSSDSDDCKQKRMACLHKEKRNERIPFSPQTSETTPEPGFVIPTLPTTRPTKPTMQTNSTKKPSKRPKPTPQPQNSTPERNWVLIGIVVIAALIGILIAVLYLTWILKRRKQRLENEKKQPAIELK